MPQAISPRHPSGSVFPFSNPGRQADRKPKAPTSRTQTNPRNWDPKRVAKYYAKHGPPATSPLLAQIVLDNKIDGHTLCDIPEDLLSRVVEDEQLAEDLRSTAHDFRERAGVPVSPTSRLPRVQDIAQSLARLTELPVPSLTRSPDPVEEHPPSPATPPPWDWSDEEEDPAQHYIGFDGVHNFLHFGSPSTAPQLFQPLLTVSPEATYELSALDVPDLHRAAEFASAEVEEVAETDVDAVGGGDHPDLTPTRGDLPSRQDAPPSATEERRDVETPVEAPVVPQERPKLRLNSLSSIPSRPDSCPPGVRLSTYLPPREPPIVRKIYMEEAVQAAPEEEVRVVYTSTAIQTRSFAEACVQAEPEVQSDGPAELTLLEGAMTAVTAHETNTSEPDAESPEDKLQEHGSKGSEDLVVSHPLSSSEPTSQSQDGSSNASKDQTFTNDTVQKVSEVESGRAEQAAKGAEGKGQDVVGTPEQGSSNARQASAEEPENAELSTSDGVQNSLNAPSLLRESSLPLAQPSPITPGMQSELRAGVMEPDTRKYRLAGFASGTVGGRRDSSWASGQSPSPLPAISEAKPAVQAASGGSTPKPNAWGRGRPAGLRAPAPVRTFSSPADIELRSVPNAQPPAQKAKRTQSQDYTNKPSVIPDDKRAAGLMSQKESKGGSVSSGGVKGASSENTKDKKKLTISAATAHDQSLVTPDVASEQSATASDPSLTPNAHSDVRTAAGTQKPLPPPPSQQDKAPESAGATNEPPAESTEGKTDTPQPVSAPADEGAGALSQEDKTGDHEEVDQPSFDEHEKPEESIPQSTGSGTDGHEEPTPPVGQGSVDAKNASTASSAEDAGARGEEVNGASGANEHQDESSQSHHEESEGSREHQGPKENAEQSVARGDFDVGRDLHPTEPVVSTKDSIDENVFGENAWVPLSSDAPEDEGKGQSLDADGDTGGATGDQATTHAQPATDLPVGSATPGNRPPEGEVDGFSMVERHEVSPPTAHPGAPTRPMRDTQRHGSPRGWEDISIDEFASARSSLDVDLEKGIIAQPQPTQAMPRPDVADRLRITLSPRRQDSPATSRTPTLREPPKEETKSFSWLDRGKHFFSELVENVASPTTPMSEPETPGGREDIDLEGVFIELTDAEVAALPKPEKDKYKKKLRKRKKAQEKKAESEKIDALLATSARGKA
ncbi:uncharacterized protein PHACADRAFT_206921 [Phanerochaete carnosa HHB-10118-sp]|uniref:Uncharacterized protein n=1 Tax=Phanerochaete carnosa (strain HHB-10118-sp) TaxID=650164 RepID=K5V5W1_PHACS|nr:uncharacterized protein PHACADRAFT_206921 [Phanerochaete carnosa HHB-10118-sp]EKM58081.1 hypothetical protein PHACADRAFT_206921 [Phanerochaete carnosa HHB-10118-sp]